MIGDAEQIVESIDFFFQAEDGIRDTSVTGVQTCALPILTQRTSPTRDKGEQHVPMMHRTNPVTARTLVCAPGYAAVAAVRSEERRVGKEWRAGGAADNGEGEEEGQRGGGGSRQTRQDRRW